MLGQGKLTVKELIKERCGNARISSNVFFMTDLSAVVLLFISAH